MLAPTVFDVRNVSEALASGLRALAMCPPAIHEDSRNGGVAVWPGAVVTHTRNPLERVLFSAVRDANPFFHLFESLWMLAGRNDLPWLAQFNRRMAEYSDDGGSTQPAAYGHRWRAHFPIDQIRFIVEELKRSPGTRRAVLAMWDGHRDLAQTVGSADVPCNTHCYFTLRDGTLDMGVMCRSNDVLWGAHGANAVHFSVLLEYVAAHVGARVGTMTQFNWNYHLYDGVLSEHPLAAAEEVMASDLYPSDAHGVEATPMFTGPDDARLFDSELPTFMEFADPANASAAPPALRHKFLREVALPMLMVWRYFKRGDLRLARSTTYDIVAEDWHAACHDWIIRRMQKKGAL